MFLCLLERIEKERVSRVRDRERESVCACEIFILFSNSNVFMSLPVAGDLMCVHFNVESKYYSSLCQCTHKGFRCFSAQPGWETSLNQIRPENQLKILALFQRICHDHSKIVHTTVDI